MATPCGIILGMRELFGSESLTQAAEFYLDVCQHYQGKNGRYLLINFVSIFFNFYNFQILGIVPPYIIYDNAKSQKVLVKKCLNSQEVPKWWW
jgi:hypothetical protein